jgi:hypothetical protein
MPSVLFYICEKKITNDFFESGILNEELRNELSGVALVLEKGNYHFPSSNEFFGFSKK